MSVCSAAAGRSKKRRGARGLRGGAGGMAAAPERVKTEMDDLTKKLENLLNSPDGMEKIQSAMAALGGLADQPQETAAPAAPAQDSGGLDLSGLLAALGGGGAAPAAALPADSKSSGLPDLSMLTKMAPLLSSMRRDDENTVLLKALRPYLHGDREKRLDDAIKIMQFIRVMPLLRDRGLF